MTAKKTLILLIILPIIIIAVYYYLFRDGNVLYHWLTIESYHYKLDNPFINAAPSFVHVFSFSLLTWLALGKKYIGFAIAFWALINLAFEVGQYFKPHFDRFTLLNPYFMLGTFSWADTIAILIAIPLAYTATLLLKRKNI